jgi:hypothetical protein
MVDLQASAREWHRLQLAALGFVGLCGVLKGDSGQQHPLWLQSAAGLLVLASLVVAVAAILLVVTVAWPLSAAGVPDATAERRVRTGVGLTFAAVALTGLSTMSAWWPSDPADGGQVTVTTTGGTACGPVLDSAAGWIELDVAGDRTRIPLDQAVSVLPTDDC